MTAKRRPRKSTGPVRVMAEVLAYRKIGIYHALTFVAPDVAERTGPGQFVSLGVGETGAVLRRPFSVFGVSQQRPWAGTLDVVFDVVGPGTEWLAARNKHDVVDLVGPLGRAFPLPQQPVACLLVGGGYGAAPLLYMAGQLQQRGLRVDMVMGASTHDRIFNAIEAKRLSASTTFTTEDGSFGKPGRVTDVMDEALDHSRAQVVYTCGPMPMLAAVVEVCERRGVHCQVAVEESMACGVGVCMTCVVPYRTKGGVVNRRSCIDGPVFNGAKVAWDLLGYAPRSVDPRAVTAAEEELAP
jgi:dihydroorotate dehydrogenase electron transfer subunit